jgi:hypothetical protein
MPDAINHSETKFEAKSAVKLNWFVCRMKSQKKENKNEN